MSTPIFIGLLRHSRIIGLIYPISALIREIVSTRLRTSSWLPQAHGSIVAS
jgi:hypothetical protein